MLGKGVLALVIGLVLLAPASAAAFAPVTEAARVGAWRADRPEHVVPDSRGATLGVVKVLRGSITEIGVADLRANRTRAASARFLRSFR